MTARRSRLVSTKHRKCPICAQRALGGSEVYILTGEAGISIFDVEKAKSISSDGRPAHAVPSETLNTMLQIGQFESAHLSHVKLNTPGIIGQRSAGPFLLDGIHRAIAHVRENRPFHAFILTPLETLDCLLSQDIGESDVGTAVRAIRQILAQHPDSYGIEIEIPNASQAIIEIRKLLTAEENRRITIRQTPSSKE